MLGWISCMCEATRIMVDGCFNCYDLAISIFTPPFTQSSFVESARQQFFRCHLNSPMLKVAWISESIVFPCSGNHVGLTIWVEHRLPMQSQLTGLKLEFLRLNSELCENPLLNLMKLTQKIMAQ